VQKQDVASLLVGGIETVGRDVELFGGSTLTEFWQC